MNKMTKDAITDLKRNAQRRELAATLSAGHDTTTLSYALCGYYFSRVVQIDDGRDYTKIDWIAVARGV